MTIDRRELLRGALLGAVVGAGTSSLEGASADKVGGGNKPLTILILGGTGFIGPHMVRRALARGHTLTLFNRGRSNQGLFPEVEKLKGDRDGGLAVLEGRTWDVVIDNAGYLPRLVRDSAELLKTTVGHYVFISSTAVYPFDVSGRGQLVRAGGLAQGFEEDSPLQVPEHPESEDVGKYYGQLKVLCERTVQEAFAGRNTILRPTFIVGPGDHSDRFTYWPVRISGGGEILAPGDPRMPVQYIDVRDLAEFVIHMAEAGDDGVYNVAGPESRLSMAEFLYGLRAVTAAPVRFTWVDQEFLAERGVNVWNDLPMRIPVTDPGGASVVSNRRAVNRGLRFQPLAVTAGDTLEWFESLPVARQANLKVGLTLEQQAELLAAWHAR